MTKLLLEAMAAAERRPEWEQDALAAMILDEIAENQRCLSAQIKNQNSDLLVKLVEETLVFTTN
ncbi:MAG: hypothetical protein M5U34_29415 [Chloroflexi bacterium]|nr:hypothetical protein [Chloroflexota bacterium]